MEYEIEFESGLFDQSTNPSLDRGLRLETQNTPQPEGGYAPRDARNNKLRPPSAKRAPASLFDRNARRIQANV